MTEVTSHQGTHTYRLSKFLKIVSAAPFRLIRQQQRGEIMKNLPNFVKHFVQLFLTFPLPPRRRKPPAPQRGAHYIHIKIAVKQIWRNSEPNHSRAKQPSPPRAKGKIFRLLGRDRYTHQVYTPLFTSIATDSANKKGGQLAVVFRRRLH